MTASARGARPQVPGRSGGWLRRVLPSLWLLLGLASLAAAAWYAQRAWQVDHDNRVIASGELANGEAAPGASASVHLARAIGLDARGDWDAAMLAYARAELLGDETIRRGVRMNLANMNLRRGIDIASSSSQADRAITYIELAKTGYRRLLDVQPDDWNARYNLELAQMLLPDYDLRAGRKRSGKENTIEGEKADNTAWTEWIGAPRGMH